MNVRTRRGGGTQSMYGCTGCLNIRAVETWKKAGDWSLIEKSHWLTLTSLLLSSLLFDGRLRAPVSMPDDIDTADLSTLPAVASVEIERFAAIYDNEDSV